MKRLLLATIAALSVTAAHAGHNCRIQVNGHTYLSAKTCTFTKDSDAVFIGTEKRGDYFAYLYPEGDGLWSGKWSVSEDEKGKVYSKSHANADLPGGLLKQEGDCWINAQVKICADRRTSARW